MLVASLLAGTALIGATEAAAAKRPALKALNSLVRQTKSLPKRMVAKRKRLRLLRLARHARRVARRRPCRAVSDLNRYRRMLRGTKVRGGTRRRRARARNKLAALGPASVRASRLLLANKRTRRCGGGVKPSRLRNPRMRLLRNTRREMRLRVTLPPLRFVGRSEGGRAWTQLVLRNTDAPQAPGRPGIPVASDLFAVPNGARLSVKTSQVKAVTLGGIDVFPAQPDPVDAVSPAPNFDAPPFTERPFRINRGAYAADGLFPRRPGSAEILGEQRDLTIGALRVPAAQYNADDRTLKVVTSVVVSVKFVGGTHTFDPNIGSPWESTARVNLNNLLNPQLIDRVYRDPDVTCGMEHLVITNPATRAAADQFRNARSAAGQRTVVLETGTGPGQAGTTAAQIRDTIRRLLNSNFCMRPSYVTIMGDDDLVPTGSGINGIPSDLHFSMRNGDDELPDVAVGRIIGNDQAAVATAVNKINNYRSNPPVGPHLTRATVAAQFQDTDEAGETPDGREDRTFIQFAETVRTGLVNRGVTVDRIYRDDPVATPTKFNDGTSLPAALRKPGFTWNGRGSDISSAWNQGRFMVVHRDHGWSDGWGDPPFNTNDVNALTNGNVLPVLLSINCSSARYDDDETSFVGEALVHPNGGAVGVFGDTRDSPSWHNTQIALGFVDGLLPTVLPSEGPPNKLRMGDALVHGKLRLAGLSDPEDSDNSRNEMYLWHYFGDPSMQMWGGQPLKFLEAVQFRANFVTQGPPGPGPTYAVRVAVPSETNGQAISLVRNGAVIGKAFAQNGQVTIPADFGDGTPDPGELRVAVDPRGGPPVSVPVSGVPRSTQLTQACEQFVTQYDVPMDTSGTLSPELAGADVVLTYTRPDGTTFQRTVQTNADGQWSDAIVPEDNAPGNGEGTWKIRSRFAGDASHHPSSTGECTVTVQGVS